MGRLIEALKDIDEAQNVINKQIYKKRQAEEEIKRLLGESCITYTPLRKLITKSIYDNLPVDKKEAVDKKRKENQKIYEKNTYSSFDSKTGNYSCGTSCNLVDDKVFDPEIDRFEITSYQIDSDNPNQIRITVDGIKNRMYLGSSGGWIPDTYVSGWINIDEINKLEQNNSPICF